MPLPQTAYPNDMYANFARRKLHAGMLRALADAIEGGVCALPEELFDEVERELRARSCLSTLPR